MAFQPFAFQTNFQQLLGVEDEWQVVVFPGELRFETKRDAALYTLAVFARDQAGGRVTSLFAPKPRARIRKLEFYETV